MNYGTSHKEYIMTMAYSASGKLKGGTRHYISIFKDEDSGKEIELNEQLSEALFHLLEYKGGDYSGR